MNAIRLCLFGAFLLVVVPHGATEPVQPKPVVRVAVVITPESSGFLRQLLADFEKQTGHKVLIDTEIGVSSVFSSPRVEN